MTEREAFEAWRDSYMSHKWKVPSLEEAWQASRQQLAQEAAAACIAKVIPDADDRGGEDSAFNAACEECATAIRSLRPTGDKA